MNKGIMSVSLAVITAMAIHLQTGQAQTKTKSMPSPARSSPESQSQMQSQPSGQSAQQSSGILRASKVIGSEVRNAQGSKLGKIDDIVLNGSGDILYTVVSYGGFLGIGETQIAVPLQAFQSDPQSRVLTLDVPQDSLKNVPPYNASQVESGDTTWLSDVRDFFTRESSGYRSWSESAAGRGQQGAMAQAGAMTNLYHASKLIGMDIRNQQAEEVGEIHDLVLDADQAHILYTLVDISGIEGAGDKLATLPWNSVQIDPATRMATVTADNETLAAMSFDEDNMPDLTSRAYGEQVYRHFNQQPYWTTYGFSGEGEQGQQQQHKMQKEQMKQQKQDQPSKDPSMSPSRSGTEDDPSERMTPQ